MKTLFEKLRHNVFWPPFILLLAALIYSLVDAKSFLATTSSINTFILDKFGWLFSIGTTLMLVTCLVILFHPIGKKKIGGELAQPILSKWRWFSIILCTTIATGIIFWGTAEPLFHFLEPPRFSGLEPMSTAAQHQSMAFMYLHWTFTPYAIYTIPAVTFALAFYNKKQRFSLEATLFPLRTRSVDTTLGQLIDGICLYALVAGMAASLGAGILTISGAARSVFGFESEFLLIFITLAIVTAFVLSAISGLMKGIRILSDINAKIFVGLAVFVLIFGPTWSIVNQWMEGMWLYGSSLPKMSMISIIEPDDPWPKSWTTFYWANWLAWAPITALFLGRLSVGYTVRQFLVFNWILPSLFGIIWMSILAGTALDLEMNSPGLLSKVLEIDGPESIVYKIFDMLPLSTIVASIFLATAFLSYVTAADSNTEAMGGISSTGISPESPSPPTIIKVIWGLTVGAVAFIMVKMAGIEGIKMLSNLGGLPSLFLIITVNVGLIYLLVSKKYRQL